MSDDMVKPFNALESGTGLLEPPRARPDRGSDPARPPSPGHGGGGGPGRDGGGSGRGWGSGGEDGEPHRGIPISAGMLMMGFFLCAVTMLFAAFIAAAIVYRAAAPQWPPPGVPPLPRSLLVNTGVILLSSATLIAALRAGKQSRGALRGWLGLTTLLGLLFIARQISIGQALHGQGMTPQQSDYNYSAIFFSMTLLHGLHLAGGLIALAVLTLLALRRNPGPGERQALGICSVYWHFVGGLWVVLYALFSGIL